MLIDNIDIYSKYRYSSMILIFSDSIIIWRSCKMRPTNDFFCLRCTYSTGAAGSCKIKLPFFSSVAKKFNSSPSLKISAMRFSLQSSNPRNLAWLDSSLMPSLNLGCSKQRRMRRFKSILGALPELCADLWALYFDCLRPTCLSMHFL